MTFTLGQYFNGDTRRTQWAVYCTASRTWYFAHRYGRRAAAQLAARLNREAL